METLGEERLTVAGRLTRLLLVALAIGAMSGAATRAFLVAEHALVELLWHGLPERVPDIPGWAIHVAVIVTMTALATLTVAVVGRRPFDIGLAEQELDRAGRIEYRHVVAGIAYSLASLASGAAVGPEAPLTDINGGLGTWVSDRLGLRRGETSVMAYAGVAGAFSAFLGLAPVGALLAAELVRPKSATLDRASMAAGLASGATAWVVYLALGGGALPVFLLFADYDAPTLVDVGWGVALGVAGAIIGLVYGAGLMKARLALKPLRDRPWLAGAAGAAVGIAALAVSPTLLFSGQTELPDILAGAGTFGLFTLVGLGVGKLAVSIWGLSTAYFGGPLFPIIFAGVCFGLAVNVVAPAIPEGVAVMAIVTGMTVAATAAPLSVTFLFALVAEPALVSIVAAAAVSSFIVRQAIAPSIPGVYRATRTREEPSEEA